MQRVYVDSNVFISLVQEEFGRKFEFMNLRTMEFMNASFDCKYTMVVSELVIEEFCSITKLKESDFMTLFDKNPKKLEIQTMTQEDVVLSKKIVSKLVKGIKDARHAACAINNDCDIICTWNIPDFEKLNKSEYNIEVRPPNEL